MVFVEGRGDLEKRRLGDLGTWGLGEGEKDISSFSTRDEEKSRNRLNGGKKTYLYRCRTNPFVWYSVSYLYTTRKDSCGSSGEEVKDISSFSTRDEEKSRNRRDGGKNLLIFSTAFSICILFSPATDTLHGQHRPKGWRRKKGFSSFF